MTQDEIRETVVKLDSQVKELENQIEVLLLQKKQLQSKCKHPEKRQYSAMGELGWYCPDCGWQT